MIYAIFSGNGGNNQYVPVAQALTKAPKGKKIVVLNGTMTEGVYEKTSPYCPIRYEDPKAGGSLRKPIFLEKNTIPWSHLPPKRGR